MAKERERKFILKYLPNFPSVDIEQGYLMFDGDKHLRIRITKYPENVDEPNGERYFAVLGFKTVLNKEEKEEYEYEIPLSQGRELMNSTEIKLTKTRYRTYFDDNSVDIDVFPDGTAWVEIEFEKPFTRLPDYCGEEITGHKEYNNIFIAKKNALK